MNILIVTNMYPDRQRPFYGIFVKEQVDSLKKIGLNTKVFYIKGYKNKLNYFKSIFSLLKLLRRKKFDIIHTHHTYCVYPIHLARMILKNKTPLIITFHEGEVHNKIENGFKHKELIKRLVFSKSIKKLALMMTEHVLSVQNEMMHRIKYKGKFLTLPCGVDTNLFQKLNRKECRKKLNLPIDKKIIFYPASPNNEQKGYYIIEKALKLCNRKDVLLYSGGNIAHEHMPLYMNAADVVIQLSAFEASPSVLKEALSIGVPVIFTDAGDAVKIIGNAKGCFISERDPEKVASCIDKALELKGRSSGPYRIKDLKLSLDEIAKRLKDIYKDIEITGEIKYDEEHMYH